MATEIESKEGRKRAIKFSNPYILKVVPLNTSPAQQAFEMAFGLCAKALLDLGCVLPAVVRNEDDLAAVNGAVEHLINRSMADVRGEIARIKKIAEDNGIDLGGIHYTNATNVSAMLTTHRAGQYLQIIKEIDELIGYIHAAWFAGFVSDEEKSRMERKWRRKAIGVAIEIRNITNRAFKAYNSKKQDGIKVETADGVQESELAEEVDMVAQAEEGKEVEMAEFPTEKPRHSKKSAPAEVSATA